MVELPKNSLADYEGLRVSVSYLMQKLIRLQIAYHNKSSSSIIEVFFCFGSVGSCINSTR